MTIILGRLVLHLDGKYQGKVSRYLDTYLHFAHNVPLKQSQGWGPTPTPLGITVIPCVIPRGGVLRTSVMTRGVPLPPPRDGVITHGQKDTNRPPPGAGGYELWIKGHNLGIMAKVSYVSWT